MPVSVACCRVIPRDATYIEDIRAVCVWRYGVECYCHTSLTGHSVRAVSVTRTNPGSMATANPESFSVTKSGTQQGGAELLPIDVMLHTLSRHTTPSNEWSSLRLMSSQSGRSASTYTFFIPSGTGLIKTIRSA